MMWRIPPETARHRRTWMAWPWDESIWDRIQGTNLLAAQDASDRLIRTIAKYEDVSLLAPRHQVAELQYRFVVDPAARFRVEVVAMDYNDIWVRDTLPTFAIGADGALVAINWNFNGWGRRVRPYAQYGHDASLARKASALVSATLIDSNLVAEGGAFAFDGRGSMVATKSVMFDPQRNAGEKRTVLEQKLLSASGCSSLCWLPGDVNEPITTGHADWLLAFVDDATILFSWIEDDTAPEFDVCDYNLRILEEWAVNQRRKINIVKVPTPVSKWGPFHCASYVNFAHANGAIIVPRFAVGIEDDDRRAADTIWNAFGRRIKVELVDVSPLAFAGGSIHCATQQQPIVSSDFC